MSLARALSCLPSDERFEGVVRDILVLFRHHRGEWLTGVEVAGKTGRAHADVGLVLPVLVEAYVIDFDDTSDRYRFRGDVALGYEIDAFMHRVESHVQHTQSNIAKFRERYGS